MFSVFLYAALLLLPKDPPPPLEGWPSALITYRLFEWYPILIITALVEVVILIKISDEGWKGALKASFLANAVSALAGILLLPLAGVAWKHSLNRTFEAFGVLGNYSMASWVGNVSYMAILLGAIEALIISLVINKKLALPFVLGWMLVNLLPLLLAIESFTIAPYDPRLL